jgi:hypothetical protein
MRYYFPRDFTAFNRFCWLKPVECIVLFMRSKLKPRGILDSYPSATIPCKTPYTFFFVASGNLKFSLLI